MEKTICENSFVQKCLNGEANPEELDEQIEYWHTHDTGVTLREYLGLTHSEYEEWGKGNNSTFRDIIRRREEFAINTLSKKEVN